MTQDNFNIKKENQTVSFILTYHENNSHSSWSFFRRLISLWNRNETMNYDSPNKILGEHFVQVL